MRQIAQGKDSRPPGRRRCLGHPVQFTLGRLCPACAARPAPARSRTTPRPSAGLDRAVSTAVSRSAAVPPHGLASVGLGAGHAPRRRRARGACSIDLLGGPGRVPGWPAPPRRPSDARLCVTRAAALRVFHMALLSNISRPGHAKPPAAQRETESMSSLTGILAARRGREWDTAQERVSHLPAAVAPIAAPGPGIVLQVCSYARAAAPATSPRACRGTCRARHRGHQHLGGSGLRYHPPERSRSRQRGLRACPRPAHPAGRSLILDDRPWPPDPVTCPRCAGSGYIPPESPADWGTPPASLPARAEHAWLAPVIPISAAPSYRRTGTT
jgi:hypothetical protein